MLLIIVVVLFLLQQKSNPLKNTYTTAIQMANYIVSYK